RVAEASAVGSARVRRSASERIDALSASLLIRSPRRRARAASRRLLLLRLVEISQIRRGLILLRGHQVSFRAQEVILRADDHMVVVLSTNRLAPDRMFFCVAKVLLGDGPRTRQ